MIRNTIKLVATDLDGTFLKDDKTISPPNLRALELLGEKGIIRVVATGRNLKKVAEVIPPEVPFDYIVFSSGAGVFNWKEKKHILKQNIAPNSSARLFKHLFQKNYNFAAFDPVPENHRLWFHKGKDDCPEFNRYLAYHDSFARPISFNKALKGELCQFLLIIPENENMFSGLKNEVESQCRKIRVIRSSSPVTKGFIWMEIFHHEVSKGQGVNQICRLTGTDRAQTIGIGNDYNDLDLLYFTAHSYLTSNAPVEIKSRFRLVPSNEEDAFAYAVQPLVE